MTSTTFTNGSTLTDDDYFNDLDRLHYDILGDPANITAIRNILPSAVAQVVNTTDGAVATGTTVIPFDDTIPQNTEGIEVMTLAITPVSATSTLVIDVVINMAGPSAGNMITALFVDTTANALAVINDYNGAGVMSTGALRYVVSSGSTSARTYKVRIGCDAAGTTTFNGSGSARKFGGVMASSITITEYLP